jgi:hypothetical protein
VLRKLDGNDVWLSVISAGRPWQVGPMTNLIGPASWYVPPKQWMAYMDAGLEVTQLNKGSDSAVVPVRNRALTDAWNRYGVPCVQLDDDLMRVMKVIVPMKRSNWWNDSEHVEAVLSEMYARLKDSPFKLAGGAPTNNAYFTRRQTTTRGFIKSGVWMVKGCELLLDEELRTKFDYDYTLQHIRRYGGVLRCDDLIFDFNQFTMKGGHSVDRTKDDKSKELRSITYLEDKWGTNTIRRNPRRPGEILLKFPKRAVLT